MINFTAANRKIRKALTKGLKIFSKRSLRLGICAVLLVSQLSTPGAQAAPTRFYIALGDSLAFGAFAPIGDGYVPEYRDRIEAGVGVNVDLLNLGIPGWKSGELR